MSDYLLDTNVVSALLRGGEGGVVRRAAGVPFARMFVCSVVRSELWFGWIRAPHLAGKLSVLEAHLSLYPDLSFDGAAAREAGALRAHLAAAGTPIGHYDLLIAATALAHDLVLVTNNVREFSRVPDLRIEDWSA